MKFKRFFIFALGLFVTVNAFAAKDKLSIRKDDVLVEYVSHNGGVFIYSVDEKGKKTPVLDTVDYGASSFIGVLIDSNYYNLKTSGSVTYKCDVKDEVLSIVYNIAKKVQLTVSYNIAPKNVLNIKYSLKNLDGKDHSVSIKSIFDTSLGEWNGTPFATESKPKIKSEYIITDFEKHKTLTSSDGTTGIRFMMDKDFGKYTYKTVIAAKPFFETDNFEGYFIEGRGFNTVLSYNNSCVGFFFKSRNLKKDKDISFSQRIEFARTILASFKDVEDDDDKNTKYKEDDEEEKPVKNEGEKPEVIGASDEKASETILSETSAVKKPESEVEKTEPVVQKTEPAPVPVYENISADNTPVENVKKTVDPEKVRELVNKIKNLEDSGKNTDRREIIQLTAELNEVLRILNDEQ